MKFKSDTPVSEEKNTTEQQNTDTPASKMIENFTIVPHTKPKKKPTLKFTTKKKKPLKKGESKVSLSMSDLYVKENPFKDSEADSTAKASKNTENEETSKTSPDVATPDREKGNPDATLISDVPESGRKIGLEDLNDAIDSDEYMDVDISNIGNQTKGDDSVEKYPEKNDVQEDVGPDFGTSLGQPKNPVDDITTVIDEKDPSFDSDPEKEVNSGNTVVNCHSEENVEYEEDPKEGQEEDCSEDREKDQNVVDVDNLSSDEIPLINTLGESVAKRLRSNKGKIVTSITRAPKKTTSKTLSVFESPKTKIKPIGVGLKK